MINNFDIIRYEKNHLYYLLIFLISLTLIGALILIMLDLYNVGTFREQNALKASYVFIIWGFALYIFKELHNTIFSLEKHSISILSCFGLKKKTIAISYNEISSVEISFLFLQQLTINLKDGTRYKLKYMHRLAEGELPDTADPSRTSGTLRDLTNLKNEIERRVQLSRL